MARQPDPLRKPQLIGQILDYLLDKPLASVSFRTLAVALNVSTFTLVYHFGTRAEMVSEIVAAISHRSQAVEERLLGQEGSIDAYFEGLEQSWQWTLRGRNRNLQRLEIEAAMLEALDPSEQTAARELYATWQRIGREALLRFGLSEADAEVESRLLVNTFFGIQYDLVLNHDAARATASLRRALVHHRERIEALALDPGLYSSASH